MIFAGCKCGMKLLLMSSSYTSVRPLGWSTRSPLDRSTLHESASSCSWFLMADLTWSPSLITSNLFDVGENLYEDSLLFGFFLTRKPRTALGLSPKRRTVSSFVHAKEEGNPSNPHISKKYFWPSFSLISGGEELSSFGTQTCSLFMVVAQTR